MSERDAPSSPAVTTVVRIRRKGGRIVQGCDVYIGRACYYGGWALPKSKWANPFSIRECGSAEVAVNKYREFIMSQPDMIQAARNELRGQTLGCWCKPGPCHGDVLAEIANSE